MSANFLAKSLPSGSGKVMMDKLFPLIFIEPGGIGGFLCNIRILVESNNSEMALI